MIVCVFCCSLQPTHQLWQQKNMIMRFDVIRCCKNEINKYSFSFLRYSLQDFRSNFLTKSKGKKEKNIFMGNNQPWKPPSRAGTANRYFLEESSSDPNTKLSGCWVSSERAPEEAGEGKKTTSSFRSGPGRRRRRMRFYAAACGRRGLGRWRTPGRRWSIRGSSA